ncbi:hypothetical protein ACFLXZ_01685 [Chloroflexota bacterium]
MRFVQGEIKSMKRKITKIWGIGLTVVLLVSLLSFAVPVSAGTLGWSANLVPRGTINQIGVFDTSFVKVASNGDIFVVESQTANIVYKSVNGGTIWTPSVALAGAAVALEVSPDYANDNTVFTATATQVYISVNGGASFSVLGGAIAIPNITSLAVSPTYTNGSGEVMVGTATAAAGGAGDVYIWGRTGVQNWTAQGIAAADVTSVAFSPNYPIDATILAVTSGAGGTSLQTKVSAFAWDATIGGPALVLAAIVDLGAAANGILRSDIAMPQDYNGSIPSLRRAYVSTVSANAGDNVFRITNVTAGVALNPGGAGVDSEYTTIAYSGDYNVGTIYAGIDGNAVATTSGTVRRCANPTSATPLWYAALNPPSGAIAITTAGTYLTLDPDFATNNKMYASTTGAESAVSISDDGGVNFYQTGMINTVLNSIQDVVAASATELYMTTEDGGAGPIDSVWKTTDGGATWVRVLALNLTNTPIVRLSGSYATDQTLYVGDTGATTLRLSTNGGSSWTARISPVAIGDLLAEDGYVLYIGSSAAATVSKSSNNGWTWGPGRALPGGTAVANLAQDAGTSNILAGGTTGTIHRSTDGGTVFAPIGGAGIGGGLAVVAFDASYETNSTIYAGDSSGATAGVWRFVIGTDTVWRQIDGAAIVAGAVQGIVVAADGTLYAAEATAAAAAAGGFIRSLTPTAPITVVAATFEQVSTGDGLTAAYTVQSLAWAEGSNVLFSIENSSGAGANRLMTYTDTLSAVSPVQVSPADGSISTNPLIAAISWEAVTGALSHDYQMSTRTDFAGAVTVNVALPLLAASPATLGGVTYYWRVRASTPVMGPWSASRTVITELAIAATNAPVPGGPAVGGTAPGGYNAPLRPVFSWGSVNGATGFEFQLATDVAFADLLVDKTGGAALAAVTSYQLSPLQLDYNATYYWRVRGLTATSNTDWSVIAGFTTLAEPVEVAPPVVVTDAPPVIITIPPAPPAQEIVIPPAPVQPAPIATSYIWAIIVIGAVLVLAVIVLIVRTRRTV